ncbi:hypothetical protein MUP77_03575 [Candidatus Bathyarchaeota archaeon]|nr:hypothetical protein [Candidatus Bathyarchaeota archaeon]
MIQTRNRGAINLGFFLVALGLGWFIFSNVNIEITPTVFAYLLIIAGAAIILSGIASWRRPARARARQRHRRSNSRRTRTSPFPDQWAQLHPDIQRWNRFLGLQCADSQILQRSSHLRQPLP